jgi:hypothetical protein
MEALKRPAESGCPAELGLARHNTPHFGFLLVDYSANWKKPRDGLG